RARACAGLRAPAWWYSHSCSPRQVWRVCAVYSHEIGASRTGRRYRAPVAGACYRSAMSITRRDFINGVGLAIASGLTPAAQMAAQPQRYPPALTGLRGEHAGSFEVAHAFAREGRRYAFERLPIEESYDCVIVGGGISGLAAAWFYRRRVGLQARILILDNHDDFGGHAKRNEFMLDGRRIIGYGGSQSLQSPNSLYGEVAKGLLRELGVDISRFETAFERGLYPS